ncbi:MULTISPECIES: EamA family transporter [unclassified Lysobacter]|uniref:EamA family transporter n=1 Tax=unclassified Lysobacter TaxID=2635362 RepID=UPI001BE82118|nr:MULTISPECIES: EamA family transporter [unclassified Lysobacter]MBT2749430.1 EamA family transporter [Lysobacter sp. ISL-42]MBT2750795.1 EamA family transporter [Lysobacter sp. ISL-50]MBT2776058.1 EamA family transporter [Lysobacter sp. ISL-54]MBT2784351.1 EamA family transporter [Lysobacter sp. ISL-52]
MNSLPAWSVWALLSAVFAALTAVLAKVGVQGVSADYATLVRTLVIVAVLALLVPMSGQWVDPRTLPARSLLFLVLSGLATGASWLCYYRALKLGDVSQVVPVDKLSVVLAALFAVAFLGDRPSAREWLGLLMVGGGVLVLVWRR